MGRSEGTHRAGRRFVVLRRASCGTAGVVRMNERSIPLRVPICKAVKVNERREKRVGLFLNSLLGAPSVHVPLY